MLNLSIEAMEVWVTELSLVKYSPVILYLWLLLIMLKLFLHNHSLADSEFFVNVLNGQLAIL